MKNQISSIVIMLAFACIKLNAQNTFPSSGSVGIGTATPDASSLLDVTSTNKGVLVPRMIKTKRDSIINPATGLLIYQTNSTPGFYYFNGSAWTAVKSSGASKALDNLTSPTSINVELLPSTNNAIDLGSTTKAWKDLYLGSSLFLNGFKFLTFAGTSNTFLGVSAGLSNVTGGGNTFVGSNAGKSNIGGSDNSFFGEGAGFANTTGFSNSFFGASAGGANTTGTGNSFFGIDAGSSNTTGASNSFFGSFSGDANSTGTGNAFFGNNAGRFNATASFNSFFGSASGSQNSSGAQNSFFGKDAGSANTTASNNSFFGAFAGDVNTTGVQNSFFGSNAGTTNVSGSNNAFFGNGSGAVTNASDNSFYGALTGNSITTGSENCFFGKEAGLNNVNGQGMVASGFQAALTRSNSFCTFVGYQSDNVTAVNLSNANAFGHLSRATAANQVRIGNSSVGSIGGFVGFTNVSDGRYKKNVKQDVPGLEFINKLNPVTYTLDVTGLQIFLHENDNLNETVISLNEKAATEKEKVVYTGFIAQEVETAAKELNYDFSGIDKPQNEESLYGLRYAEFTVPLVKAVQQLSKENNDLKSEVGSQKLEIESLKSEIEAIKKVLNKTSNKVELQNEVAKDQLGNAVPNPTKTSTTITYQIAKQFRNAAIRITDNTGAIIRNYELAAQTGEITFNASIFKQGMYQYTLIIEGNQIETKQFSVIK